MPTGPPLPIYRLSTLHYQLLQDLPPHTTTSYRTYHHTLPPATGPTTTHYRPYHYTLPPATGPTTTHFHLLQALPLHTTASYRPYHYTLPPPTGPTTTHYRPYHYTLPPPTGPTTAHYHILQDLPPHTTASYRPHHYILPHPTHPPGDTKLNDSPPSLRSRFLTCLEGPIGFPPSVLMLCVGRHEGEVSIVIGHVVVFLTDLALVSILRR